MDLTPDNYHMESRKTIIIRGAIRKEHIWDLVLKWGERLIIEYFRFFWSIAFKVWVGGFEYIPGHSLEFGSFLC